MDDKPNNEKYGLYELSLYSKNTSAKIKKFFFEILMNKDNERYRTVIYENIGGYDVYNLKKRKKNSLVALLKKYYNYDESYDITILLVCIDGNKPFVLTDFPAVIKMCDNDLEIPYFIEKMTYTYGELLWIDRTGLLEYITEMELLKAFSVDFLKEFATEEFLKKYGLK